MSQSRCVYWLCLRLNGLVLFVHLDFLLELQFFTVRGLDVFRSPDFFSPDSPLCSQLIGSSLVFSSLLQDSKLDQVKTCWS